MTNKVYHATEVGERYKMILFIVDNNKYSGFDNYHKIAVRVPKFWCTRHTWANK